MCDLNICRVCLNKDVRGYKMDQLNLRQCYEQTIRAKVNDKDGLPRWFCYECAALLNKFDKFRERCFKGQLILRQIKCTGDIMYGRVGSINRYSENLMSSIGVFMTNRQVKTFKFKHKYRQDRNKENSSESVHNEIQSAEENLIKNMVLLKDELTLDNLVDNDDIEIKQEIEQANDDPVESNQDGILFDLIRAEKTSSGLEGIEKENTNDLGLSDDNMDIIGDMLSSDDENIALNDIIKARNGINTEDNLPEIVSKPKSFRKNSQKNTKVKPRKFTVERKSLDPNHWKKLIMSDDEAMTDFKLRVNSSYYTRANYKCELCFTGFSTSDMLERHMKRRHDESIGPYECKFCHHRFPKKWCINRHMLSHYSVYQCLRCEMQFREKSASVHDDVHSGKIRKCEQCGKEFKHSSTYYTHLRMRHRSAHICTICGDSFINETGLYMHTKRKHLCETEPPRESTQDDIYCAECDIKFASRIAYEEHFYHSIKHGDNKSNLRKDRRYTKEKQPRDWRIPTTCKHCGKHFASLSDCKKHHLKDHTDIPLHRTVDREICEVCGASISAGNIAKHMVTHTGERAHPCSVCGKRFSQKSSVRTHYNTVHLKQPQPKYPRRKPYRRRKKATAEIVQNDFAAFVKPGFYT